MERLERIISMLGWISVLTIALAWTGFGIFVMYKNVTDPHMVIEACPQRKP